MRLVVAPPFRSVFLLPRSLKTSALLAGASSAPAPTLPQFPTHHRITGEVWAVDEEMLAKLDVFEGCPIYYERLATEVERLEEPGAKATGEYIECFAYFKKTIDPSFHELVAIPEYHPDPLYVPPEKRPADWKKYYISQDKTS